MIFGGEGVADAIAAATWWTVLFNLAGILLLIVCVFSGVSAVLCALAGRGQGEYGVAVVLGATCLLSGGGLVALQIFWR